jgi:alkylation response protein AidB-like acyl-CoA dehydrogenase
VTGETEVELRSRLGAFLDEHAPGLPPRGSRRERIDWQKAWTATLYDNGFAGPGWPRRYGGMDLPFDLQVCYHDEMSSRSVPSHPGNGPGICGPTIIKYGTDEQRERFLPPMLRGDEVWAQGFSEPEAGSDLPSLQTRARQSGDEYVVTGRKIWSSYGDVADFAFTLVRTGPPGSRERGISYLLIDLTSPAVTVSATRDMSGDSQFSEITFDEARVPVANRVGEENGGWPIARTAMGHERAARTLVNASEYRRRLDAILRFVRENGRLDPWLRDRLARVYVRVRILWLNAVRSVEQIQATGEAGASASVARLYQSLLEQDIYDLAVDLAGPTGLLVSGDPHAIRRGAWAKGLLRTRAATIGAGTAEIQRNTIAERVLGLPREP